MRCLYGGRVGNRQRECYIQLFKCSNAKNRKGCHKKAVRKDYIEEAVLLEVADKMFTEDMIDKIADKVMVLQDKEDTAIPLLKKELAETEKYIDNLIDAMQMGMLTKSTKQRLDELEARKEQLEADIINEEINSRKLSRGQVIDWLKKMKSLDLASDDNKRIMVDTFVNSVYLYDDRMVVSFNCREKVSTLALPDGCVSDGRSLGEPK